jgi:predicted RNA binding protein with dsRBD fold (UPF0201 family)
LKLRVECPVYPTEEIERVEVVVKNLFGHHSFEIISENHEKRLLFVSEERSTVDLIRDLIYDLQILDVVRARLIRNLESLETDIFLDKQAAYSGRLRVIDQLQHNPSLGSIRLHMSFVSRSEFDDFLRWFSPRTEGGEIVGA